MGNFIFLGDSDWHWWFTLISLPGRWKDWWGQNCNCFNVWLKIQRAPDCWLSSMNLGYHKVRCNLFFLFKPWNLSAPVSIFLWTLFIYMALLKTLLWKQQSPVGSWGKDFDPNWYQNLGTLFFFFNERQHFC